MAGRERWRAATDTATAARRAGGRRGHNARRRFAQMERRARVAALIRERGFGWGEQARIAAELGVSQATISRDVAALRSQWWVNEAGQRWLEERRWEQEAAEGR